MYGECVCVSGKQLNIMQSFECLEANSVYGVYLSVSI